jgi:hypothetical protein
MWYIHLTFGQDIKGILYLSISYENTSERNLIRTNSEKEIIRQNLNWYEFKNKVQF